MAPSPCCCMHCAQVWVKVTEIRDDPSGQPKINCSMRAVSQEDGRDLDPGNAAAGRRAQQFGGPMSDAPPEARCAGGLPACLPSFHAPHRLPDFQIGHLPTMQVGSILEASVASHKPFGIFVRLKGYQANGLVHLSQASGCG